MAGRVDEDAHVLLGLGRGQDGALVDRMLYGRVEVVDMDVEVLGRDGPVRFGGPDRGLPAAFVLEVQGGGSSVGGGDLRKSAFGRLVRTRPVHGGDRSVQEPGVEVGEAARFRGADRDGGQRESWNAHGLRLVRATTIGAMMAGEQVIALLGRFERAGLSVWIGGGWGIDALLGEQTREHRDLDLLHRAEQEPRLVELLAGLGYAETVDWRPVRFVMERPDGLEIDLHPLVFKEDGSAEQASLEPGKPFAYPASAFTTGTIEGEEVPCLSVEQQVHFHQGYEPSERDLHDMARLRERFGIATHF